MTVDVLAIGAHPDDVEIGVGGLVHKLMLTGRTVGILDLTRGELSTRGTVEERNREADSAAKILGASIRKNAELPDGGIADTPEQRAQLIPIIRQLRPRALLAPMSHDRHPDHHAAHGLVKSANYFAGVTRAHPDYEPYRIPHLYFYRVYNVPESPQLVVDVSESFETKLAALRCYASQFHNPDYPGEQTYVSSQEFWDGIRIRAEYWGARIGVRYAEPLYADLPIGIATLPGLEVL